MTDTNGEAIAASIHKNYAQARNVTVDKSKLCVVFNAFRDLYASRSSANEEHYYLENLIGTEHIEGRRDVVFGTVPDAIERTKEFIRNSAKIYSHQAEIYSKNLLNVIRKEEFSQGVDEILSPHITVLEELARGNI